MSGSGTVLVERYRLEERLSGPDPLQGSLWRAVDVMAGDLPVATRQLESPAAQARVKKVWPQMQSLLHHQLLRCGELFELDGVLWLVRDWQEGVACDVMLRQRRFGAGEVLTLLRQILPVLAVLHSCGLMHGEAKPRHLLLRRSDGLPVLLDGGLTQRQGATDEDAGWRDLHDLGVTASMLLSGSAGEDGGWPEGLELEAAFRQVLERMLFKAPGSGFGNASEVLKALESVVLPGSEPELTLPPRIRRARAREQVAEDRLWPVVMALALSALVGSAIGWFLLPRTSFVEEDSGTNRDGAAQQPVVRLPRAELDQRQQPLSRLLALQVNRGWFHKLINATLLRRFPQRGGSLPLESLVDEPLRRVWAELAEGWLARIEQLPPAIRALLGRLRAGDWVQPRQALLRQGVRSKVLEHLVSAGSQALLPGSIHGGKPAEPFRQLWIAAAMQSLGNVEIVRLKARLLDPTKAPLRIPAGGASLVLVEVAAGGALALGTTGTPLMQMMVFGAKGQVVEELGPLRVVWIAPDTGSPLQVLITNEGISSALFTLSCRADPLDQ